MSISSTHANGFNSSPGITTTPFGSNGATVMDIYSKDAAGTQMGIGIGMGTATPQATFDVAGTIRPGSAGITTGQSCTAEGALAYDIGAHQVVYCDQSLHWATAFASGTCTEYYTLLNWSYYALMANGAMTQWAYSINPPAPPFSGQYSSFKVASGSIVSPDWEQQAPGTPYGVFAPGGGSYKCTNGSWEPIALPAPGGTDGGSTNGN
jgi:hypothetical protein